MKEQKVLVTMRDMQKYKVMQEVAEKKLKGIEAAEILKLTPVHISRLKVKFLKEGLEGILRKMPASPPNKKITATITDEILRLRKKFYYDFNVMHFKDKLEENHRIHLCYESLRQILIKADDHHPKKKKKVHRQRRRMPKAGLLVQMDSSQHRWIESLSEKWWLIAMIDDATNEVPYAKFFLKDTFFTNMQVIRRFIEIKGLFVSLYADKASHFKTTRYGGIHHKESPEQDDTQIERALEELDINLIPANSPQAKGRIEVTFRLFQDRLIKEMRLAGIKTYAEANKFLQDRFLPYYNAKWTHRAETAYLPLAKDKNLDLIFCLKKERIVNGDNTIRFNGQTIQILPSKVRCSFAGAKVEVCQLEDGRIFVLYNSSLITTTKLDKNSQAVKRERKAEELLNTREYTIQEKLPRRTWIPSPDHPWRSFTYGKQRKSLALVS